MLVLIKTYRVRKRTLGGFDISLPPDWGKKKQLTGKEDIGWYVDTEHPDHLVLKLEE